MVHGTFNLLYVVSKTLLAVGCMPENVHEKSFLDTRQLYYDYQQPIYVYKVIDNRLSRPKATLICMATSHYFKNKWGLI